MDRSRTQRRWSERKAAGLALGLTLTLALSGCSSDRALGTAGQPASPSFGDRISKLFGGGSGSTPAPVQSQSPMAAGISVDDLECPTVVIRTGTSTYLMTAPGVEPSVTNVRYQATFGQTARECKLSGTNLVVKVGIQGRVILGPAGGPGHLELPLRYAVVQEGPEPKTLITRLRWVKVDVPEGETNVPYTEIEEELTFPVPRPVQELEKYVIYVGFDRSATKEPEKKPQRKPVPRATKRPT